MQKTKMPAALSAYFDLARISAALIVMFSHAWPAFFPRHPLPWPGHQAVVVFFVLSGYVVAFVADTKESTLGDFALSRAVRILSVTVPALLLTLIVSFVIDPAWRSQIGVVVLNLFFLGESWGFSSEPNANPAYWSLCYEVWYYAIFAGAVFPKSLSMKALWSLGLAALAGPKILLLLPCWLCGVALYYSRYRLSRRAAVATYLATVALYGVFFWFDVSVALREQIRIVAPGFIERIQGSNQFAGDGILALIVSANFAALYSLAAELKMLADRWGPIFNYAAAFTLSIYLFHIPVILLLQHYGVSGISGLMLTVAAPVALAFGTELRRFELRNFIRRTLHVPVRRAKEVTLLHQTP